MFANVRELRQDLPRLQPDRSLQTIQHSVNDVPSAPSELAQGDALNNSQFDTYQEQSKLLTPQLDQSLSQNDYRTTEITQTAAMLPQQMDRRELKELENKEAEDKRAERENYVKTIRMIMKGIIDIFDILLMPPEKRSREQNCQIACFLSYKIDFFRTDEFFDAEFMYDIAERIETRTYRHKERVLTKGEVNDRLFVSLKGKLGVYRDDAPGALDKPPSSVVDEFTVIGERSLELPNQRKIATVACIDPEETLCITITRNDYRQLVNVSRHLR
jgi:uncharacterized protein YnzC (UPF0291/DUF896 family)